MVSFPIPYWSDLTVLYPDSLLGTHGEEAYFYLLSGQERPKPSPASGECLHPAGGINSHVTGGSGSDRIVQRRNCNTLALGPYMADQHSGDLLQQRQVIMRDVVISNLLPLIRPRALPLRWLRACPLRSPMTGLLSTPALSPSSSFACLWDKP